MKRLLFILAGALVVALAVDAYAQVPDTVRIGVVLPLTGDLSSFGLQLNHAARLAADDFNAYLAERDASWRVHVVTEDTETNPVRALEKTQALHSRGIDIVIGPAGSAQLSSMLGYLNDNNMIAISPSSTAPALAIPDDAAFRTVPDDYHQGKALGALLEHDGVEVIIPMWRGDVYGDGLVDATISAFESRGGISYDGVRYNPDTSDYSVSVADLADKVAEAAGEFGADNTAVLFVAFDEAVSIFQTASTYDILDDVRWFGGEAVAQSTPVALDPLASEFAMEADLITVQLLLDPGDRADSVSERLEDVLGEVPNAFAYTTYDAVWLAGLSVLEADSADPAEIRKVIRSVSKSYSDGALSSIELNEAGDLILANYETWLLTGSGWVRSVSYDGQQDVIVPRGVVEGTGFAPNYKIQGGSVIGMYTDPQEATLVIELDAGEAGMIEIELPRILLDAKTAEDVDEQFFVLVDGEESAYEEIHTTENSRTLTAEFLAGTERIEIIGTWVAVPEFGIVGMAILAAGLVLATVFSVRYGLGRNSLARAI